jgi:hypothetical protein
LSTDRISGDGPGLAYRPTFALLVPAFIVFEANNQLIKVSLRVRAVRKTPNVKRVAGFPVIRDSICADVETLLSPMNEFAMNLATGRVDR